MKQRKLVNCNLKVGRKIHRLLVNKHGDRFKHEFWDYLSDVLFLDYKCPIQVKTLKLMLNEEI